jgi:glycosyltransferase involved in cell wall biosynthesis
MGNAPVLPGLLPSLRGFHLVHLHCPFISGTEWTSIAASYHKTPLVVTYHSDLVRTGTWRDAIFSMATKSSRLVLRRAARVLFVSEGHASHCDMRELFHQNPQRCQVLPNGVDTELFRPASNRNALRDKLGLPNHSRVIGFVGALDRSHHYKGLDVLLKAMQSDALMGASLLIAGDGELRHHYEQLAIQLGIREHVHFQGRVEQAALPSVYAACDVVAMPSRVPESFGLVAAEALACGVPVIASDSPGLRSLVIHGENGYLVHANDSYALAEQLNSTLSLSEGERIAMSLAGRRQIETSYAWSRIGHQLAKTYAEVLADHPQAHLLREQARLPP